MIYSWSFKDYSMEDLHSSLCNWPGDRTPEEEYVLSEYQRQVRAEIQRRQDAAAQPLVHINGQVATRVGPGVYQVAHSTPPWRREYLGEFVDTDKYPHTCPRCGAAAYIGLNSVDCTGCK